VLTKHDFDVVFIAEHAPEAAAKRDDQGFIPFWVAVTHRAPASAACECLHFWRVVAGGG
jgi:hypothetical protein